MKSMVDAYNPLLEEKEVYSSYKNIFVHAHVHGKMYSLEIICESSGDKGTPSQRRFVFETSKPIPENPRGPIDPASLEKIAKKIYRGKWVVDETLANDRYSPGVYGPYGRIKDALRSYSGGLFNPLNWFNH